MSVVYVCPLCRGNGVAKMTVSEQRMERPPMRPCEECGGSGYDKRMYPERVAEFRWPR